MFLTTWMIWDYLFHPTAHPLYRRMLRTSAAGSALSRMIGVILLAGSVYCCGTLIFQASYSALVPLLAAVFLSSNVYVVVWVMAISATIARERENRTYDPLVVTPAGELGAILAICVVNLHRHDALLWVDYLRLLMTGLLLLIMFMILMVAALSQTTFDIVQFLRVCLDIVAIAAAFYLDHVQTIVLGCLVGMLAPIYGRTSVDARLLAVGVFIMLQAVIFAANLFVVMFAIPTLYEALPVTGWLVKISQPVVSLLAFYLIREVFNATLWKMLIYRSNATSAEVDLRAGKAVPAKS